MIRDPDTDIAAIEVMEPVGYEPVSGGKRLKYPQSYPHSTGALMDARTIGLAPKSDPELAAIAEVDAIRARDDRDRFTAYYAPIGLESRAGESYLTGDEYSLEDMQLLDDVRQLKGVLARAQVDVVPTLRRLARVMSGLERRVQYYARRNQTSLAYELESTCQFMAGVASVACQKYSVAPEAIGFRRQYFGIGI